jgi:[protein-PII] uridylyltransferase
VTEEGAGLGEYASERRRLLAEAQPGTVSAARLAALTDEAVATKVAAVSSSLDRPFAVVALGGYGAGRLLPGSDIDLLVLVEGSPSELDPLVRAVLYPLWDMGLKVGHQIRSPRDQRRMVREDRDTLTASLTARFVAGDRPIAERTLAAVAQWAHKHRRRVAEVLRERERLGSPYLLEPDLKGGAGGQRDIDEMVWLAAAWTGSRVRRPRALVEADLLSATEAALVSAAQEVMNEARWRLHAGQKRPTDVMSLAAAEDAGIDADAVQGALADAHHMLLRVRERVLDREAGAPARGDSAPISGTELFSLLDAGPESLPKLERIAYEGRLDPLVAHARALMTLRRPGLSHRYTVGAHSLRAAAGVASVADDDPLAGRMLAEFDTRTVQAAALVHDAGKRVAGPDHGPRGASEARRTAEALGLEADRAADVEHLVREHLLLSETAFREDLADEDTILGAAARVGARRLVAPLYVLTVVDSLATGPDAWTPWRAALVGDLATKVDAALADPAAASLTARARRVRDEALRAARSQGSSREVQRFIEEAPSRYASTLTSEDLLRHARLVSRRSGPGSWDESMLEVTATDTPGTFSATVVTRDRPGLLATMAGAFALSGLDILRAQVHTAPGGIAVDTFSVRSATLAPVEHSTWSGFERRLKAALSGRLDIESRLAQHSSYQSIPTKSSAPEVRVDTSRPVSTVVEVRAADRPGLLHDLALTIRELGLDIGLVTADTRDGVAVDTFHLTDEAAGEPVRDARSIADLRAALETAARHDPDRS